MAETSITLNFGNKVLNLVVKDFDDVDIDSLLKIDYSNLVGEMITFPVIVNRFGMLVAEMDNKLSEVKLDLDIYSSKRKETLRNTLSESDDKGKIKKPTLDELDNALIADKVFQLKKKKVFTAQKERDYINSIFWASKDKSNKLDKMSLSIQPGDVDTKMLQKSINGISIKFKENVMK